MQNITELPPEYLTSLAKLSELLRFYQITRKTDKFGQVSARTSAKISTITEYLKTFSCFEQVSEDVMAMVEKTLHPGKAQSSSKSNKPTSVKFSEQLIEPPQNISSINSKSSNSSQGRS
jgi:hypothetical protein